MTIISRATWRPRYADGGAVIGTSGWREVYLHHSVTNPPGPNATLEQEAEHMRYLEGIGQREFGQGISYTVVVFPSGRAWQGHSIDRRGAHTYQRNDVARAICLAGNYEVNQPTQAMLDGVDRVLAEWGAMGKPSRITGGHRDVFATACPGKNAYSKISYLNSRVGVVAKSQQEDDVPNHMNDIGQKNYHGGNVTAQAVTNAIEARADEIKAIVEDLRDGKNWKGDQVPNEVITEWTEKRVAELDEKVEAFKAETNTKLDAILAKLNAETEA